ncbi:MAG: bifunctional tetrahydrofolate synthase/dihydrofolate synthase [Dokdonella sp.]
MMMATPRNTLDEWLSWQMQLHPREIELGLNRVRTVWQRLGAPAPAKCVITVAGTNGKGSTVAFLETILLAGKHRVGAFTSPHLLQYNERVRVQGDDATDVSLITAFERIEKARGETALTYFEFGTLAALLIFAESALDVAILEVGLGGRLDAVNIIDADAAIVTTVDLDHQDWLGSDRETIAREKAGIFREGRPAILGESSPPSALIDEARRAGSQVVAAGTDFHVESTANGWRWKTGQVTLQLPNPGLDAPCQRANAAAAIAALYALRERINWNPQAITQGVASARAPARMQRFAGAPELIVDVAHNPQAARMLAEWLRSHPANGRTIAVFGALADKDVEGIVEAVQVQIDGWQLASLDGDSARGLSSSSLAERLQGRIDPSALHFHPSVAAALDSALAMANPEDRIIAFGSFFVAAPALARALIRQNDKR